jgi:hypothetical protein
MTRAQLARLAISVSIAGAAVPTLGVGPAHACSCTGGSDAEHFKTAQAVFTGTLLGRDEPNASATMQSSADPVIYTFAVGRIYKNYQRRIANPQKVESVVDGASCGLELRGNGPFVIFTSAEPFVTLPRAMLCGGTREVAAGEKLPFGRGQAPAAAPTEEPSAPDTLGPTVDDDEGGSGNTTAVVLAALAGALIGGGIVLRRRAKGS